MIRYRDGCLIDLSWLSTKKLEFKILVMSSVLAIDNKAFLGEINDITQYLGIVNNKSNRAKINSSLYKLTNIGYIKLFRDSENYIIALSYNARNDSRVISIQKPWISVIKNYNKSNKSTVAWESMLRVFLYLIGNSNKDLITYKEIASDLYIKSETTIERAINALCKINFDNLIFEKETIKSKKTINGENIYKTIGTKFRILVNFDCMRLCSNNLDN